MIPAVRSAAATLFAVGMGFIGAAVAGQQGPPPEVRLAASSPTDDVSVPRPAHPETTAPAPSSGGTTQPPVIERAAPAAAPLRVRVPSIEVDSDLLGLGLDADNVLEVPQDPALAGWFSWGTAPGDDGAAVIAGHVDSQDGPAVFYDLSGLQAGDEILIDRADGTTAVFRVDDVLRYPKDDLPTTEVYAAVGPALRLITCAGDWDEETDSYRDNVVAYATLVETR